MQLPQHPAPDLALQGRAERVLAVDGLGPEVKERLRVAIFPRSARATPKNKQTKMGDAGLKV